MPTRYLRPGIRDSEPIDSLSERAEILFYRLVVTVDDFGRTDARPSMIKAACFPIRQSVSADDCESMLAELVTNGLILVYDVDGKLYLQMRKWDNVPRAKESKFPAPEDGCTHTYTNVRKPRASVPLTVTVTGTKTETGTDLSHSRTNAITAKKPEEVTDQVWNDFIALRKLKRAGLTETALNGIRSEARKAAVTLETALQACCANGWQGFRADWFKRAQNADTRAAPESFRERDERLARQRYEEATNKRHVARDHGDVVDITPPIEYLEHADEPPVPLG